MRLIFLTIVVVLGACTMASAARCNGDIFCYSCKDCSKCAHCSIPGNACGACVPELRALEIQRFKDHEIQSEKAMWLIGKIIAVAIAAIVIGKRLFRRWQSRNDDWKLYIEWKLTGGGRRIKRFGVEILVEDFPNWNPDTPTPCCDASVSIQRLSNSSEKTPPSRIIFVICKGCKRAIFVIQHDPA